MWFQQVKSVYISSPFCRYNLNHLPKTRDKYWPQFRFALIGGVSVSLSNDSIVPLLVVVVGGGGGWVDPTSKMWNSCIQYNKS